MIFATTLVLTMIPNNTDYDQVIVNGDEITTEKPDEEKTSEKKSYQKKGAVLRSNNDYLTVDHLGLFSPDEVDNVLTVPNYDLYYDNADSFLKSAIVNKFIQNKAPFTNGNLSDSLLADISDGNTDDKIDIYDTYFPTTQNGSDNDKHIMMYNYWNSDNEWHVSNITIPNCPSDLVIVDGVFISRSEFTADSCSFQVNNNGYNDYEFDGQFSLNDAIHLDTTDNLYKMDYHNRTMIAYSDVPIYFKYNDIEGTEDDYLLDTYHYDQYMNVYNAIGSDDTGFVVDRRLYTGSGLPEIDDKLGFVGGSFYNLFGGASKDNMQMLVLYEMNDYTKQRRNTLKLCQDYTFQVDGTVQGQSVAYSCNYLQSRGFVDEYRLGSSNYVQIDLSKIFNSYDMYFDDRVLGERILNYYRTINGPLAMNDFLIHGSINPYIVFSYLIDTGFTGSSQVYDSFSNSNYKGMIEGILSQSLKKEFSVKFNLSSHNVNHREWYNDELRICKLTVRQYLVDEISGNTSSTNIWEYDFINGSATDNNALIVDNKNENDEVIPWNGSYPFGNQPTPINSYTTPMINPYQTLNPAIYPANNSAQGGSGGSASAQGGSGGSSNVTVNVGGGELAVIDYPYEVIQKVMPNVTSLITTMKNEIIDAKEGSQSVIALTKDVFSVFPSQVWTWVLTGVSFTFGTAIYYNWRTGGRR